MIYITNTIRFDQSFDNFVRNNEKKYVIFSQDDNIIPKKILDRIRKKNFKDEALANEEAIELKKFFENKIKKLLSNRVHEPDVRIKINFLGQIIGLNITPRSKNDQDSFINILFKAYTIVEECLNEKKPVYLSIIDKE